MVSAWPLMQVFVVLRAIRFQQLYATLIEDEDDDEGRGRLNGAGAPLVLWHRRIDAFSPLRDPAFEVVKLAESGLRENMQGFRAARATLAL